MATNEVVPAVRGRAVPPSQGRIPALEPVPVGTLQRERPASPRRRQRGLDRKPLREAICPAEGCRATPAATADMKQQIVELPHRQPRLLLDARVVLVNQDPREEQKSDHLVDDRRGQPGGGGVGVGAAGGTEAEQETVRACVDERDRARAEGALRQPDALLAPDPGEPRDGQRTIRDGQRRGGTGILPPQREEWMTVEDDLSCRGSRLHQAPVPRITGP